MQKERSETLTFSLQTTTSIIVIITTIIFPSFSYGNDDSSYSKCSSKFFNCGKFQNLSFPFWGDTRPSYCGHPSFELRCDKNLNTTIEIMSISYRVIDIRRDSQIMKISRLDFAENVCPAEYPKTELDSDWFNYTSADNINTLFYHCSHPFPPEFTKKFSCNSSGVHHVGYLNITVTVTSEHNEWSLRNCKKVVVPVLEERIHEFNYGSLTANDFINEGFEVMYGIDRGDEELCRGCDPTGGACGYNSTNVFNCFCQNGVHCLEQALPPPPPPPSEFVAKPANKGNLRLRIAVGLGAAALSIILMLGIFFIYRRRNKQNYFPTSYVSRNTSSDYSSKEDLKKTGNACGVHIFTYSELVEATNNFDASKELGDGGFGTVYYGKLKDGRAVAVKRLYENNFKRVEQFMNEVQILTHMRHPNLVLLYGCTSRHSRELLLVYEYIPNGTVADHLHGERYKHGSLNWSTRLKIAIETASALVYLHASVVIHRDVKTTNILLDNTFCVKVADFGLSRLFPTDVTHISTAPQGTPGYVDPDYHQCYQLTDKSDVYSFGVVMIELISSKPAVDITRHRHEINLSNMAITKIQNGELHELVDMSLGYESDSNINKMINAVAELAFQCLQSDKDLRPTMEEVFKTLIEIQKNDPNVVKPRDIQVLADDDDIQLNKGNLVLSPNSVTVKWDSNSTTPNPSV